MVRDMRTHLPEASGELSLGSKSLTKQQFAKKLYNLIVERGWNQSEFGRRTGLPRDSISTYVRGHSLPTPVNLKKMADVLGMAPEELLPNHIERAIEQDPPAIEIKSSIHEPGLVWLRINQLVKLGTAIRISQILDQDNAAPKGE